MIHVDSTKKMLLLEENEEEIAFHFHFSESAWFSDFESKSNKLSQCRLTHPRDP